MFKKMENPAFQRDAEKGVELLETKKSKKQKTATNGTAQTTDTQSTPVIQPSTSCKPEICQAARNRYSPPELAGSPWHKKKTIYLITFLVLLVVWIVIFTTLSQLKVL